MYAQAYMSLLRYANLSGPTTWAPAIYKALEIVKRNNCRYHVLVIISDGQVNEGRWEAETKQAIVTASHFPLSIIMVRPYNGYDSYFLLSDPLRCPGYYFTVCCPELQAIRTDQHACSFLHYIQHPWICRLHP